MVAQVPWYQVPSREGGRTVPWTWTWWVPSYNELKKKHILDLKLWWVSMYPCRHEGTHPWTWTLMGAEVPVSSWPHYLSCRVRQQWKGLSPIPVPSTSHLPQLRFRELIVPPKPSLTIVRFCSGPDPIHPLFVCPDKQHVSHVPLFPGYRYLLPYRWPSRNRFCWETRH